MVEKLPESPDRVVAS